MSVDQLPTRADLDAATATTAAVMADPAVGLADRYLAAEAEEAAYARLGPGPCDRPWDEVTAGRQAMRHLHLVRAEPQAEPELEPGAEI